MANTFYTDLLNKRTVNRVDEEGVERWFTGTVQIPIGTSIAQNDAIEIGFLGAGQQVTEFRVFTDDLDDGTTMVWDVGYSKLSPGTGYAGTNTSGDSIDYGVDTGTTGVSPATDQDYFVASGTFGRAAGWSTPTLASTTTGVNVGLAGPVRIIATQTASTPTQTTASTTLRTIQFEFRIKRAAPNLGTNVDRGGYA